MAKGGRRMHSGRKRVPVDLRMVQGNFQASRHGGSPLVPAQWPEPPSHLNERELALWRQLRTHCESWTAPSDWLAINGVVSLMDRVLKIQEAQRATPEAANPVAIKFTPSADGEPNAEPKENPLFGMELKAWRELRAFIGLTGLSPVDRARMQKTAADDTPVNPLDKFIKTRG